MILNNVCLMIVLLIAFTIILWMSAKFSEWIDTKLRFKSKTI
jgi:hypothetical protein